MCPVAARREHPPGALLPRADQPRPSPAIDLPMTGADGKLILAIEASGREASVALRKGEGSPFLEPARTSRRHEDDLMPAIGRAFARSGARPPELSIVCTSVGPGGFTGLRIAVATAKMLALALGCRIVAVRESEAMLEAAGDLRGQTVVCLAGKRGCYATTFCSGAVKGQGPVELLAAEAIAERAAALGARRILVSQPLADARDLADRAAAAGIESVEIRPNALHVLTVGARLAAAGEFVQAGRLLPEYAREPEAVRLWKRRGI